jgi:hypothetical protein
LLIGGRREQFPLQTSREATKQSCNLTLFISWFVHASPIEKVLIGEVVTPIFLGHQERLK